MKKSVKLVILLTTCFIFSQESLYSSLSVPDDLRKSANAVVRLNDFKVTINSKTEVSFELNRIVTVFNEKGQYLVQAGVGYDKYRKIRSIEAIIFDESGEEIKKIKKKDFIDHSAVDGGTLYSDSRVLFMGYTPISYPYTVKFSYELETINTAFIPSWQPIDSYFVGIENDKYSLVDNANLGLRFKENSLDGFNVEKNSTETTLNYSIKNVSALKPEALSPSIVNFTPYVMIAVNKFHYHGVDGYASNWLEFGNWMKNSLLDGRNQVTTETKQKILSLVSGVDNPIERAKLVYQYVQENTRYISVQVGIGGIQPIPALEVDQLKYGDCKGLTNYTQALLEIADVPSYYTIVQAGREIEDFDETFPTLQQGNHIILAIPNDDDIVWVDCTSQSHPFGFIGDFTDNRNVLLIKQDSSEIVKTTKYIDGTNYQNTKAEIDLNESGAIQSKIIIKTKGVQYDNRFGIETQAQKDIIEYYKEYWGNVNNLEVEKYNFKNNKNDVEFTENVNINATNYGSVNGERLIFKPNAFNKNSYIPDRYRNRKLPLEIQRGYLDEDNFSISIPDTYTIEALPESIAIKNKFGEYIVEFIKEEDNKIIYKRKLKINKGNYLNTEYNDYRNFRRKISRMDDSSIILKKI